MFAAPLPVCLIIIIINLYQDEENRDENSINNKLSDRNSIFVEQNNIPIYENLPIMSRIDKNKYKNN